LRVLITGGAGFLGIHLGRWLLDRGYEVTLFDLPSADPDSINGLAVEPVEGDVSDFGYLQEVIRQHQIEAVVHLATLLTEPCMLDPVLGTRVNCLGMAAVLWASVKAGVRKVVYGSSVAVFGPSRSAPDDATIPVSPPSVYGATKLYAENLARVIGQAHSGTQITGLRFGWVYGPGRTRGWNVLQEIVKDFAIERENVQFPDYHEKNDWTYVDDAVAVVEACLRAEQLSTPVYNVPGDFRGVWEAVAHLQRKFPHVKTQPYPAKLPPSAWNFTSSNLLVDTGFCPGVKLEEGLDRTVAWYRASYGLSGDL
jgi:UDP-glucose 4-epimerase